MRPSSTVLSKIVLPLLLLGQASAQFQDDFDKAALALDPSANNGWAFYTGDGSASMDFQQGKGHATILVDATTDQLNIWWALIRRRVSADFDLSLLSQPNHEFRIEARIRASHAPRRVNLHLNTQRTTDFHSHLMEFDIPDTLNWYTISMTTHDFDAQPDDRVYGQLALMDWGLGNYRVDLDYFKVDIVNTETAGPDRGVQVPYRPPIAPLGTFAHQIIVAQDAMIDSEYPDVNFSHWHTQEESGRMNVLTVNSTQFVIMRWDLSKFAGRIVAGSGVLELTTHSLQRSSDYPKDFGMVRVVEILGGDPEWNRKEVTYHMLCQGHSMQKVLNSQMIIDIEVAPRRGDKNLVTISNPVLQRMLEGKTLGLALRPLGAVHASFYAKENQVEELGPKLYINVVSN